MHAYEHCLLGCLLGGLDGLDELGNGLEEVSNETDVGDLEDGGVGVLVDGNNELGLLHTGKVLDGTRDTNGDVELGGDNLSGLADLERVVGVAGVDGGTRGTDGCNVSTGQRQTSWYSPAPRASARGSRTDSKFSFDLRARPPETTLAAEPRSGRDETTISSETNLVSAAAVSCDPSDVLSRDSLLASTGATSSTAAEPPSVLALLKAVVRTVTSLTPSLAPDLTLRMALPA